MLNIEKTISNFIEQQFPFFLQEEGPMFIEFVKQYYIWMETQQAIYHARNIPEYKDIDTTTDEFLVYFKEKYLKEIQFNTAASLRRMTKHSLDLYRSKGTSRAIDLLFKVVFDTPAEVYLPGDDIFRLSSGDYYQQKYLEVIPSPYNILYVGKEVVGLQSGATAFIEKLTRKKIKGTYIEVFTISALVGHFITNEFIKTVNTTFVSNNPKVIGSLTNVDILSAAQDFAVGDTINIESTQGTGAKGRVTSIADVTGQVDFQLVDGGFGYASSDTQVKVSDKVFRIANVSTDTTISNTYFADFDLISANQYGVDVYNITGTGGISLSNFIGDHFFTYYANGVVKGEAVLQDFNNTTSNTFGQAYITLLSGNVDCRGATSVNAYFSVGNTISANLGPLGIVNLSPSANIIGTTANVVVNYANSLSFAVNELVYQVGNNGVQTANGVVLATSYVGITGSLTLGNNSGVFVTSKPIYSNTTNRTANVTGITLDVGVNNLRGFSNTVNNIATVGGSANLSIANSVTLFPFMLLSGNNIASGAYISSIAVGSPNNTITMSVSATANGTSNITFTTQGGQFFSNGDSKVYAMKYEGNVYSTGFITNESTGALASFQIANTIGNPETIELNTDYISNYASVAVNASNYGFHLGITNVNTIIANALNFNEYTIGTILNITGINNGEGYDVPPIVKLVEPLIYPYNKKDINIAIQNASQLFFTGEIVTQPNTGAKGIIESGNTSVLAIRQINFENDFSNNCPNTTLVGAGSGSTAQVSAVTVNPFSKPMGLNATVTANVVAAHGSVSGIEIIDSGYGFQHREYGTFASEDGTRVGTIQMLLGSRTETDSRRIGREGHSLGYYRSQGGFLSVDKKIYDAYYYQDYSYEIRSSVTLDKYEAMLKQLLHVAGTKYFSSTITSAAIPVSTTIIQGLDEYNFTVDSNNITIDSTLYTLDTTFIAGYTG